MSSDIDAKLAALKVRSNSLSEEAEWIITERDRYRILPEQPSFASGQGTVILVERESDSEHLIGKLYRGRIPRSIIENSASLSWDHIVDAENAGLREIGALAASRDAGISGVPELVDWGRGGFGVPFSIMRRAPGTTLADIVSSGAVLSAERVLHIVSSVASIMESMHALGPRPLIHRDLSWHNILVDDTTVTVLDWGSSKQASGLTENGTIVSTRYFTAPEIFDGKPVTRATDVYSLGRITQALLLGKNFVDYGGEPVAASFNHLTVPRSIIAASEKATRAEPSERYSTMRHFREGPTKQMAPVAVSSPKTSVVAPTNLAFVVFLPKYVVHNGLRWEGSVANTEQTYFNTGLSHARAQGLNLPSFQQTFSLLLDVEEGRATPEQVALVEAMNGKWEWQNHTFWCESMKGSKTRLYVHENPRLGFQLIPFWRSRHIKKDDANHIYEFSGIKRGEWTDFKVLASQDPGFAIDTYTRPFDELPHPAKNTRILLPSFSGPWPVARGNDYGGVAWALGADGSASAAPRRVGSENFFEATPAK